MKGKQVRLYRADCSVCKCGSWLTILSSSGKIWVWTEILHSTVWVCLDIWGNSRFEETPLKAHLQGGASPAVWREQTRILVSVLSLKKVTPGKGSVKGVFLTSWKASPCRMSWTHESLVIWSTYELRRDQGWEKRKKWFWRQQQQKSVTPWLKNTVVHGRQEACILPSHRGRDAVRRRTAALFQLHAGGLMGAEFTGGTRSEAEEPKSTPLLGCGLRDSLTCILQGD